MLNTATTMKTTRLLFLVTLLLCFSQMSFAQGASCATADPFCTENGAAFPASTSTTAESGPDYGCLLDQPNPAWYYLQIDQSGNIDISLTNSQVEDIDFICWGPFNSLASACGNLTGGGFFDACSLLGTYPCGNIVDCSFELDPAEEVNIPNAVSGQYYMVLITNYSGVATDIFATTLGSSTGTTDCSIVPPPNPTNCLMDFFSANISACAPDNTFGISGDFTYVDNPGTGTVTVVIDNGTNTYTQTFNPPFVDGQTYSYNITGVPADGAASTITVSFSADPACSQSIAYTAVADCSCPANIGTFSETVSGQSNIDYVLCFGDALDVNANNDYTAPDEQFNPPGPTYDPGIGWLVYSCPPTVGLVPTPNVNVSDDPCFLGVWGYGDLAETNDQYWINAYPGVFTDNIVYFVPLTIYSIVDGYYSYTNTSTDCYDMGVPYAVQYLPEMTMTQAEDCATGEVTATFNGGLPAIDGSQFTVVAGSMTPASAVFVNTTCTDGGTIVLGNLAVGDNYSFDVEDGNGCGLTVSGTMDGSGNVTLTYPQTDYCITDPNTSPNLVGAGGGTYSASPAGLSINAATGVINIAASTAGQYDVTYVGAGATCPPSSTFTLEIHPLPLVNAGVDQSVCSGTQVTLSGSGDPATYTWNNGVSNGVPFTPAATQTYTVTATTAFGCINTDQVTVTVETAPVPSFAADVTSGCSPLDVTFTNLGAGVNCSWDFGNGSTTVGCGPVTTTYVNVGCYDVTLTTSSAAGCTGTTVLQNYICISPDPIASFSPVPAILSELDPTTQMLNSSQNASAYAWNFGDGTTSAATNPSHTYPGAPASYTIELIAYSPFGCTDTAYATVVVEEELIFYVPNTFTPDDDEFNQTFKPIFSSGFDPYDFNMLIFNRWGEIIFESNNAEMGWDGTYHGKYVQEGTYTWKIEFKTSKNDARKIAVGHTNVLR